MIMLLHGQIGVRDRATESTSRRYFHLNYISVPLISVLALLGSGVFDRQTIRDGVVGTGGIRPLNIMALFVSLAYISISLDATGLLRFLAFWVASKGGSSGHRLYMYLYVFFLLCGVIVGNDPVILSGTAFLAYFTGVTGITPPSAWIFSQFAVANMASVVLVSSNPTNLVLSGAFAISFLSYAAHVVLPFLAAALCVFPLLLVLFRALPLPGLSGGHPQRETERDLIPKRIYIGISQAEVRATLVDARGAVFGSVLLVVTLAVLVGVSTVGVPVWEVTVPPAVIMLVRDIWFDWTTHLTRATPKAVDESRRTSSVGEDVSDNMNEMPADTLGSVDVDNAGREHHELQDLSARAPTVVSPSPIAPSSITPSSLSLKPHAPVTLTPLLSHALSRFATAFPTVTHVLERLPVALLPFAFLMFILVQGLTTKGWVELFARWWGAWVTKTGVLGAVGGMGFLTCVTCNFCGTNIGATILLGRILQLWLSSSSSGVGTDARARDGAIYALALGSNFGAFTLTFSASLAGLLWREILGQKGIHVGGRQFLVLNLPISFVAMAVGCAVLVGQVYVEHGRG
ncbi:hypothetical protein DICSQDRAFT_157516 [Dichomitus squalens LYAD-421 SS1]|uniref:Citrate transporter-like domain-containing protein n=1 Tax=Dichomitus squalens (strain LYAD-421) TaxID=732165 RepID=R7SQD5_DICSQ|nr:uncharacterized protein DICSQDRAFT_157516 [Dichomitus squalens LYAD-421 SS1]EJF57157.1 hypothetical protein DICSQDRAFT_157516 [Dichomitus squalens LYAD-421 SS1]